jgi:hypothetical protein
MARHYLYMKGYDGLPDCRIEWSPNVEVPPLKVPYKEPPTLAEDVWKQVQQWYRTAGKPIPKEEAAACLQDIAAEKAAIAAIPASLAAAAATTTYAPAHGSPEFWKAYWAKKRAAGWVPKKEQK